MANITLSDIEKTAGLAKLEFTAAEKELFTEQFSRIVGFVEKIGELDTENVPPMTHAVEKSNVTRPDEVRPSLSHADIEAVAPRFQDGHIVVNKVIEY